MRARTRPPTQDRRKRACTRLEALFRLAETLGASPHPSAQPLAAVTAHVLATCSYVSARAFHSAVPHVVEQAALQLEGAAEAMVEAAHRVRLDDPVLRASAAAWMLEAAEVAAECEARRRTPFARPRLPPAAWPSPPRRGATHPGPASGRGRFPGKAPLTSTRFLLRSSQTDPVFQRRNATLREGAAALRRTLRPDTEHRWVIRADLLADGLLRCAEAASPLLRQPPACPAAPACSLPRALQPAGGAGGLPSCPQKGAANEPLLGANSCAAGGSRRWGWGRGDSAAGRSTAPRAASAWTGACGGSCWA